MAVSTHFAASERGERVPRIAVGTSEGRRHAAACLKLGLQEHGPCLPVVVVVRQRNRLETGVVKQCAGVHRPHEWTGKIPHGGRVTKRVKTVGFRPLAIGISHHPRGTGAEQAHEAVEVHLFTSQASAQTHSLIIPAGSAMLVTVDQ